MALSINLDPKKTAFVVIDLQKMILAGERKPHAANDVLQRCAQIADQLRTRDGLVVLVHVSFSADLGDRLQPQTEEQLQQGAPPQCYDEIDPAMKPDGKNTLIVAKRQWGAFYGTDLELQLRRRGIDTIILGGIATNFGVESTARDGWERGFQIVFVEDATTSTAPGAHEFAYATIFPRLGLIASTDDVLKAFQ